MTQELATVVTFAVFATSLLAGMIYAFFDDTSRGKSKLRWLWRACPCADCALRRHPLRPLSAAEFVAPDISKQLTTFGTAKLADGAVTSASHVDLRGIIYR